MLTQTRFRLLQPHEVWDFRSLASQSGSDCAPCAADGKKVGDNPFSHFVKSGYVSHARCGATHGVEGKYVDLTQELTGR